MWLFSRWIVRALAAPRFFDSYEAIGLITTAVTLYALYMVMIVILGRTGRTEFNFPAAISALLVNVVLNLLLVPPLGIVGAGLALVASYLVVIALMYGLTQRLFPVPYQWGRLARVALTSALLVGVGELVMPTSGVAGLLAAPSSSPPTRSASSTPASSPPASASGSPACATPARSPPSSSACAPAQPRSTAASRRSTRLSAWTTTRFDAQSAGSQRVRLRFRSTRSRWFRRAPGGAPGGRGRGRRARLAGGEGGATARTA